MGVAWGSTLASVPILVAGSSVDLNAVDDTGVLSAMRQIANFDVTNHSWNAINFFIPLVGLHDPQSRYRAVDFEYAFASELGRGGLGSVIVQGIGNDNREAQGGGLNTSRYTISVAAIGEDGFAADFSNYGACVLVTAPGVNIHSTELTGAAGAGPGDYAIGNGTSFSGPIVSGVAALMLQANPNLGWRDVQNILAASATHTGSGIDAITLGTNENSFWYFNDVANWNGGGMHFSNDYGYGLLNAYNAVRMAEVWSLFQAPQVTGNELEWFNWDYAHRAIPDSGSLQASVNLTPATGIDVEHVDVVVELTHTNITQLRIFLVAPSGTEVQLFDGSGTNDATADGGFRWTFGVDSLRGENAQGNWTLRVEDTTGGDTGMLTFSRSASSGEPPPPTTPIITPTNSSPCERPAGRAAARASRTPMAASTGSTPLQ